MVAAENPKHRSSNALIAVGRKQAVGDIKPTAKQTEAIPALKGLSIL
jgi:hypothetical protein